MNIAMIWHIVKKDVRHTWMWIAAFLASLAGFGYTYSMMLLSCCDERIRLWTNAFEAMTVALVVAVTLFLAKLFHAEALPGTRQYWLARPVNWPDLLAAKTALAFAVILPSLTFMMIGIVSSQGFDIRWHISQLLLRIVIVAGSLLPVFALLAVTKNLQQVSIWLVGSFIALVMVNNMAHGMSSSWVNTSTATLDQATIEGDPIHVPSVCLVELTYLVEKGRLPHAARERLIFALDDPTAPFRLAPLDRSVADALELVSRNEVPDLPDRIISATAVALRVPLVSRDGKIRASQIETIW